MNIGQIKQNDAGIFMGRISTLAVAMTIALKPVQSSNPRAPRYEIHALTPGRTWVQVGAFFELTSNNTGEAFLNGRIDDPSLAAPLQVSAFRQDDGSYNVVWQRAQKRRDVGAALGVKADDDLSPPFGADGGPVGNGPDHDAGTTDNGLGETTAPVEEPVGKGRGRRQRVAEDASLTAPHGARARPLSLPHAETRGNAGTRRRPFFASWAPVPIQHRIGSII